MWALLKRIFLFRPYPTPAEVWQWEPFIAWLEKKSPNRVYSYFTPNVCLIDKYCWEAWGISDGWKFARKSGQKATDFRVVAWATPRTFEAALKRAKKFYGKVCLDKTK